MRLFLHFLVSNPLTERRVKFKEFELALNLLLILTREIHVFRLSGAEL